MRRYGKRFFGILLAFCMVISMLPAAAVASAPGHSHCVCGKTDCTDTEHGAAADFQSLSTLNSTLNSAHYYLSDNVTADTDITISGDVTLCLNGKTLSMGDNTITVSGNAVLTICDCGTLGAIIGNNSGSGSLISVTDGGTLQVNSGTLSMEHTGSNSQGIHTVNLSAGSSCSFTNCTVSLTTEMSGFSYSASTVYQEGGSLTAGVNAKISFRSAGLQTTGSGALCATGSSQVTLKDGSSIEASHTDGSIAFAAYIGVTASACTADITGGSITGVLMVNGEANISGGSFNYIINYGTLKMTGGTVNSSVGSCIRNQGTAELSNVRITESTVDGIGITNDGEASLTLGDGVNISAYIGVSKGDVSINGNVTIDAVKYGVNPSLVTLTGALRLYNPASHPICGASCSHDTPHSSV